jgi:hypothetical protein
MQVPWVAGHRPGFPGQSGAHIGCHGRRAGAPGRVRFPHDTTPGRLAIPDGRLR